MFSKCEWICFENLLSFCFCVIKGARKVFQSVIKADDLEESNKEKFSEEAPTYKVGGSI